MSNIHNLLAQSRLTESTVTADNVDSRPDLLAFTRATTKLIYQDLVAIQPTTKPNVALFGVKYLNPNKDLTFVSGATYGGAHSAEDRKTYQEISIANKDTFAKDAFFLYEDVVFKVLADGAFAGTTETELFSIISEAITAGAIRMAPEAAETAKFEGDEEISEAGFQVNKWQANVRSRKFKTSLSVELAQDIQAAGFDAPELLEDVLATQMAEEINKDVMQSMITVSKRFKVAGVSDKGVLDLSDTTKSSVEMARTLYRYICEMNAHLQRTTSYSATFVQASSRVAALLTSSGWMEKKDDQPYSAYGVLNNGLVLYCDNTSPMDYVVVGVKDEYGEKEMVGSLFYAPYIEGLSYEADTVDHIGAYKIITDPSSLQPKIALLVRYALCVNPYTVGLTDAEARVIDTTNMDNFVGQSEMSVLLGVKLPPLVK